MTRPFLDLEPLLSFSLFSCSVQTWFGDGHGSTHLVLGPSTQHSEVKGRGISVEFQASLDCTVNFKTARDTLHLLYSTNCCLHSPWDTTEVEVAPPFWFWEAFANSEVWCQPLLGAVSTWPVLPPVWNFTSRVTAFSRLPCFFCSSLYCSFM